jgi:hypothetical protein
MDNSKLDQGRTLDLLSVILQDAGVTKDSAVRVTGKAGLASLIWLCRMGFDNVAYVRPGDPAPTDPGDVLLVLHSASTAELEQILADHGRVREGGVLIAQTSDVRTPDDRAPIHLLLERAGYAVERCIARRSREVHVARRLCGGQLRKAA